MLPILNDYKGGSVNEMSKIATESATKTHHIGNFEMTNEVGNESL